MGNRKSTNPLVLFHKDCADGFGAAFAAWLKLGDAAEYVPASYGDHIDIDFRDRDVYVLDFSYTRERMDFLFEFAKKVVWLDHHKSAFEMWCGKYEKGMLFSKTNGCYGDGNFDIILNDNKSGTVLAWEWFHGTEVPLFIKHIDDYDRWQFKLEGTKAFQKALWSYAPWSFIDWKIRYLNRVDIWSGKVIGSDLTSYIDQGNAILRAHEQNVQAVVKGGARRCGIVVSNVGNMMLSIPFSSYAGLAANCPPHLTSDVGHALATQSGTFGLCWTLSQEGMIAKCSLRSNGDYDVSAIARAFGGGGHLNSAGFEVPIETLLGWMK